MANLYQNLFPFWVSPPTDNCKATPVEYPGLDTLSLVYVASSAESSENKILKGFPASVSPVLEFSCGVGYLTDQANSTTFVNYATEGYIDADNGRIIPSSVERFKVDGLNGFFVGGNGVFVMTTFVRNNKPTYRNENNWAVWYDEESQKWAMTDALNFHPSKTDYNYRLDNDKSNPDDGIYVNDEYEQKGYTPNANREELVVKAPVSSEQGSITKISASKSHTLFLDEDGCVWATGKNNFNQLNDNDVNKIVKIPQKFTNSDVVDIEVAENKSFIIKMNGSAFVVGENTNGETAIDGNVPNAILRNIEGYPYKNQFGVVESLTKISGGTQDDLVLSIKSFDKFTYILKLETEAGITRKNLYSCGQNLFGQLGLNHLYEESDYGAELSLVASDSVDNDLLFDTGMSHAMWIRQGRLFGVGKNNLSQIGLDSEDEIYYEQPYYVNSFEGVLCKKVLCGANHSMVLLEDNTLFASGDNGYGQCGVPNTTRVLRGFVKVAENIKDFSLGDNHSLILNADGKVFCAGSNQFGQCATNREFASLSGDDPLHSNNGFLECRINGDTIENPVSYIHAGGNTSFIIVNKKVYGAGFNVNGNLGLGSSNNFYDTIELSPVG